MSKTLAGPVYPKGSLGGCLMARLFPWCFSWRAAWTALGLSCLLPTLTHGCLSHVFFQHILLTHVVDQVLRKDNTYSVGFGVEEAGWVRGSVSRLLWDVTPMAMEPLGTFGGCVAGERVLRLELCPALGPMVTRG